MTCNGEHVQRFTLARDLVRVAAVQIGGEEWVGGGKEPEPYSLERKVWRNSRKLYFNIQFLPQRKGTSFCRNLKTLVIACGQLFFHS